MKYNAFVECASEVDTPCIRCGQVFSATIRKDKNGNTRGKKTCPDCIGKTVEARRENDTRGFSSDPSYSKRLAHGFRMLSFAGDD